VTGENVVCGSCRAESPTGSRFCGSCGEPLATLGGSVPTSSRWSGWLKGLAIVAVVAVIAAVVAVVRGDGDSSAEVVFTGGDGVVVAAAGVRVEIPPGTVTGDGTVRVAPQSDSEMPPGAARQGPFDELTEPLGIPYQIEIEDASLPGKIQIEFDYNVADLPDGAAPDGVFAAYFDNANGMWVPVAGSVDAARHVVVVEADHLSWWQVWAWDLDKLGDWLSGLGDWLGQVGGAHEVSCEPESGSVTVSVESYGYGESVLACPEAVGNATLVRLANNRALGLLVEYPTGIEPQLAQGERLMDAMWVLIGDEYPGFFGTNTVYLPPGAEAEFLIPAETDATDMYFDYRISRVTLAIDVFVTALLRIAGTSEIAQMLPDVVQTMDCALKVITDGGVDASFSDLTASVLNCTRPTLTFLGSPFGAWVGAFNDAVRLLPMTVQLVAESAASKASTNLGRVTIIPTSTGPSIVAPANAGFNTGSIRGSPARTGEYLESGLAGVPILIWKRDVLDTSQATEFSHVFAPFVAQENLIFVAGASGPFDAATGQRQPNEFDKLGPGLLEIEVRGSVGYATTVNGSLLRFNTVNNVIDWAQDGDFSTFVATNDMVYAGGETSIAAFDADNPAGAAAWSVPVSGVDALAANGASIYAVADEGIFAFDAADGHLMWRNGSTGPDYNDTSLAVYGEVVVVALPQGVYALATNDGTERWFQDETTASYPYLSPAIANGIVVAQSDRGLFGLDAATGRILWLNEDIAASAEPSIADGVVYTGDQDGLVAVDLATGEDLWRVPAPYYIERTAVAYGKLYATSYDGELLAYGPASEVTDSVAPATTGLLCRDLDARGYSYLRAVAYWVSEGMPDRMDADRNGRPCETVYPVSEVDYFLDSSQWGSGLFCRDLYSQDAPFSWAVLYWIAEGRPDRMDADRNGIPCETVYPGPEIDSFIESAFS
jgi:outer membrane protein assembly factor BamB